MATSQIQGKGGAGRGQGRKPKTDEVHVRNLAVSAIEVKYGSAENGFKALLESKEPALIKWVFEHGYGKPSDSNPPTEIVIRVSRSD